MNLLNTIQTFERIIVNSLVVRFILFLYKILVFLESLWLNSRFCRLLERSIRHARLGLIGQFFTNDPKVRFEKQAESSLLIRLGKSMAAPFGRIRILFIEKLLTLSKASLFGTILSHLAQPEGWQLGGLAKAGLAFLFGLALSLLYTHSITVKIGLALTVAFVLLALWRHSLATVAEIWLDSSVGKAFYSLLPSELYPQNREKLTVAPPLTGASASLMYFLLFALGALLAYFWIKTSNPLVLALPLILIIIQVIVVHPVIGLWGVAAYPFIDWLLRLKTASLANWWDELLMVLIVGSLFVHWITTPNFRWRSHPTAAPLTAFISVMLFLFLIDHTYPSLAIPIDGLRVVIQHMLWFYLVVQLVRSPGQASLLIIVFTFVGAGIAAYGVYQYVTGAPMPSGWVDQAEDLRTRAYSIVGSPNILGSLLVLTTPIALGLAYQGRPWQRLFYLGITAVMALGLLFSFSRGAWLGLALAVILFSLLQDRRLIALMLIGAILLPVLSPSVSDRIGYLLSPEYFKKSSTDGRLERWSLALEQLQAHPITGAGFGRFGGAAAERHRAELPHRTLYTDNYYMKTGAETGLVGLISFILLMVAAVRTAVGSAVHGPPRYRPIAVGIACGLFGVVLHNAVENVFEVPLMVASFWLCAALVWVYCSSAPTVEKN
ncbi:hypothetical protein GJ688_13090 [Heliobacillus mobilis]|uniref:O-antigen ligase-related domain-containing protein n=1 Tax=Heliobacterium mobile TaxID=28064 RepID=A0A6I3SLZ7_HELMO|nr:O-antigen ligase family protein [Heliobacterium mobile]MTV49909.1 hypothetical protein [Heliobacterium mobile]